MIPPNKSCFKVPSTKWLSLFVIFLPHIYQIKYYINLQWFSSKNTKPKKQLKPFDNNYTPVSTENTTNWNMLSNQFHPKPKRSSPYHQLFSWYSWWIRAKSPHLKLCLLLSKEQSKLESKKIMFLMRCLKKLLVWQSNAIELERIIKVKNVGNLVISSNRPSLPSSASLYP